MSFKYCERLSLNYLSVVRQMVRTADQQPQLPGQVEASQDPQPRLLQR